MTKCLSCGICDCDLLVEITRYLLSVCLFCFALFFQRKFVGEEENSTALFNTLLSPENYSSSSLEYNELQGNKLQLGCQLRAANTMSQSVIYPNALPLRYPLHWLLRSDAQRTRD